MELLARRSGYSDPFAPSSPWSLILVLVPETEPSKSWIDLLGDAPESSSSPIDIPPDVLQYVAEECQKVGWLRTDDPELFEKLRVRQTDAFFGGLDPACSPPGRWYTSVARVLKLYRSISGNNKLSLSEFESASPEENVERLFSCPGYNLRAALEVLVLPYLHYVGHLDILSRWVSKKPLSEVASLAAIQEVQSAIFELCNDSPTSSWQLVSSVADAANNKQWRSLAEAGRILVPLGPLNFSDIKDPNFGTLAVLDQFVSAQRHWRTMPSDLEVLKRTVFSAINQRDFDAHVLRGALRGERFMFIASQKYPQDLLIAEVQRLVRGLEVGTVSVAHARSALDLCPENCASLQKSREQLSVVQKVVKFNVPSEQVLNGADPMKLVSLALENTPEAYRRPTELTKVFSPVDEEDVREACVEAALAQNDFKAAARLCDSVKGSGAWLACLQAGKFISPDWDDGRPAAVVARQRELLARSLRTCPAADLSSVLSAWQALDSVETDDDVGANIASSVTDAKQDTVDRLSPQPNERSGTPQLQNLFVRGLGWAIGATD